MNDKGYAVIAEDCEPVRNIIGRVINSVYKGEVEAFPNGEKALDFCLKHPDDVSLLLTEWYMPGENIGGEDIVKGLMDENVTSIYPDRIIIASDYFIGKESEVRKKYGIKHVIEKPFSINDELIPAVKKVLEKKD